MRFSVKNQTGETWPAYGIARLGNVLRYDGPNADVALYDLKKPDGVDGIYVVNGAANLTTGNEGTAIHYSIAEYVYVKDEDVVVGDKVGAKDDKWNVSKTGIAQFRCVNEKNTTTNVTPVIAIADSDTGTKIISFAIVSSDVRSAIVEIRQRSFTGTVYDSILEDSVVTVYDTDGCYLNEPNAELTGRLGKAVLMRVDDEAAGLHFADQYDPPEWYWNVLSICCPSTICEAG